MATESMSTTPRWTIHAVLLFTQFTFGISYVLNKVALNNGVNKFVFSVYRDTVAILLLAPLSFYAERSSRPQLNLQIGSMIFGLGFIGVFSTQILLLTGLALTAPGFTSVFQSLTPVLGFLISVVFRLEEIRYRRRDGQAKLLGVVSCISGAVIASLFKGPSVNSANSSLGFSSWNLGAFCLIANCLCMATYINLQAPVLKRFPAPFSLTALSYLCGAFILAFVALITVEPAAWRITKVVDAVAFIYAGVVTSGLNFGLQTWCVQKAGVFIVIAYFPLQAIVASILAFIFLNDSLFVGSVVGGLLIVTGLYLVTWGQVQQRKLDAPTTEPLLG